MSASVLLLGLLTLSALASYEPNYAERMLPPFEGTDSVARLWHPWSRFPLRVRMLDNDGYFRQSRYEAVRHACDRWKVATNGKVSFIVERGRTAVGAQIVVRLRSNEDLDGFGGLTRFQKEGFAYIQLSATRSSGVETDDVLLERVATHEIGHALGIEGHSPDKEDIMSTDHGSTDITVADVNTLRLAYRM